MLSCPFRCCNHIRRLNAVVSNNSLDVATYIGHTRNYNKDKGSCCKDLNQTEGKQVEQWPKSDPPPPAWRAECPTDPQPPNYDPYRIKVADVVVPPLPPSNAKEIFSEDSRELFNSKEINVGGNNAYHGMQDLFYNSPIIHPDYWKEKPGPRLAKLSHEVQEPLPKLGYHGKQKYKYAFHEPWKPLDRITLLAQAEREEFGEKDDVSNFEKTEEQIT